MSSVLSFSVKNPTPPDLDYARSPTLCSFAHENVRPPRAIVSKIL